MHTKLQFQQKAVNYNKNLLENIFFSKKKID